MHSNFITPPEIVDSILIIDATEQQIHACADRCKNSDLPYNIYFYNQAMNNIPWLEAVTARSDVILQDIDSTVLAGNHRLIKFGSAQQLLEPADFFTK